MDFALDVWGREVVFPIKDRRAPPAPALALARQPPLAVGPQSNALRTPADHGDDLPGFSQGDVGVGHPSACGRSCRLWGRTQVF